MVYIMTTRNVHRFSTILRSHSDIKLRDVAIIGVGGVTSSAAVLRMARAGATLVACATALGVHGVPIFEELSKAFSDNS